MDPHDPQFLASRVKGVLGDKAAIQAWYSALPMNSKKCDNCSRYTKGSNCGDIDDTVRCAVCKARKMPRYYPPLPPTVAEHSFIDVNYSSQPATGASGHSNDHNLNSSDLDMPDIGTVSSSDWKIPQDHPLLAILQLQRDEIARLRGAIVDAAHKAQYFAMEHLYVFKAKLLNQARPLSVESQGFLDLIDRLEEVFSQLYFEIDSAVVPVC
ncbi:hypothetical protein C8F04DRAFT_1197595 [Mycena alexandri]|uniref:Uncharacterized protein n=1 Tax=Mycena alexandri TaxID=1745969 RepID=A0AAD6S1K5_9AGAR|nr:hypothetical protein C8F04DRAFT_1197595 [Mycena alexandri]